MSTFLLVLLIVVLALAGGFLGELLEAAFVFVIVLAAVGALIGFLLWRAVRGLLD